MLASNKRPRSDVATDRATFDKLVWLCQNAEAYDDGAYWVLSFKEVDGSLRTVRCYPGEEGTRVDAGHAHRMLFGEFLS